MKKTFNIEDLIRPNIRELSPYRSARDDLDEGILLDANENSLGAPYPEAEGLHRYPSPHQDALRRHLAAYRNVRPEHVFVGVGSDEAIDLLYRIFCRPGKDRVIITPPTYGMYKVSAHIHGVDVDEAILDEEFQPKTERILAKTSENTKLLFLCSPNNPTGNMLDHGKVEMLISRFPGIVVVDEAYIDFSEQESWASKIIQYPNLVVMQTMSKSFGLAGIRMGIAFASEAIINYLMKVKAPYNINALTSRMALKAFDYMEEIRSKIDAIKEERNWLRDQLSGFSAVQKIFPSDANFLLVRIDAAQEIYRKLTAQGIIVRYRGNEPLCENCLRITVGTRSENERLLNTLENLRL